MDAGGFSNWEVLSFGTGLGSSEASGWRLWGLLSIQPARVLGMGPGSLSPVPGPWALARPHGGAGATSVWWKRGPEESFSPNVSFQLWTLRQGEGFARAPCFCRHGTSGVRTFNRWLHSAFVVLPSFVT